MPRPCGQRPHIYTHEKRNRLAKEVLVGGIYNQTSTTCDCEVWGIETSTFALLDAPGPYLDVCSIPLRQMQVGRLKTLRKYIF